jgi:prevent-host-death family protein
LYNVYQIMARLNVSEARSGFSDIVNSAAYGGKRTVISRHGTEVAAVIPIEDLRLLERFVESEIDRQDIAAARSSMPDPGDNISLEDLKQELSL